MDSYYVVCHHGKFWYDPRFEFESSFIPLVFSIDLLIKSMFFCRESNKMEEAKLGKCIPEQLCCPGDQRQMLEGMNMMQPLTIKTEQAKRSCNTCLTNSPKKVNWNISSCSSLTRVIAYVLSGIMVPGGFYVLPLSRGFVVNCVIGDNIIAVILIRDRAI